MKILPVVMMTVSLVAAMVSTPEAACSECHSKNPKMRKMHEALGYKDCFKCHRFSQMNRGADERAAQMYSDPLCTDCHKR